ncbi:MAG: Integral rane protein [Candidatus Levybacteria bacterium]|nr:Integral rane protein [Candidatus Levybacteria bacterium]
MWFWLALASAVLGAVDVILSKKILNKVSPAVLTWFLFASTIPILILLAYLQGIPVLNLYFFVATTASSLIFIFVKMITNSALRRNLISKIMPLSSFSGFFTYIFGLIFLAESIRPLPLLGLFSIISGAYILNADQAREDFLKPFKLLFLKKESLIFILAVMMGSFTAILDKSAIASTIPSSPVFTILIEQTIMTAFLGAYLAQRENRTWFMEIKNNFWLLAVNGIVFLVQGLLVFYAYNFGGAAALVVGVRRLQLFFILLMGYLFFKDKPTKHIWIATAIMILGVLMIKLG